MRAIYKSIVTLLLFSGFIFPNDSLSVENNLLVSSDTSLVSASSVIEKYLDAIGGREILESVVDKKNLLVGEVNGIKLSLEIYQKKPNKYYQKMEAGELKQETKFNGEAGIQIAMGRKIPILGDQLEMLKVQAILNPQLNFDKLGIKLILSGNDLVNGKLAHEVTLNLPSGKQWLQYYDAETGYLVKQITSVDSPQGSFTVTSTYSDYKDVQSIMYAHKITQAFGVQVYELTLETCEINTDFDDDIFDVE